MHIALFAMFIFSISTVAEDEVASSSNNDIENLLNDHGKFEPKCKPLLPTIGCSPGFRCDFHLFKRTNDSSSLEYSCTNNSTLLVINDPNLANPRYTSKEETLSCSEKGYYVTSDGLKVVDKPQASCSTGGKAAKKCNRCFHPSLGYVSLPRSFGRESKTYAFPRIKKTKRGCSVIRHLCNPGTKTISYYNASGHFLAPVTKHSWVQCAFPNWHLFDPKSKGVPIKIGTAQCADIKP